MKTKNKIILASVFLAASVQSNQCFAQTNEFPSLGATNGASIRNVENNLCLDWDNKYVGKDKGETTYTGIIFGGPKNNDKDNMLGYIYTNDDLTSGNDKDFKYMRLGYANSDGSTGNWYDFFVFDRKKAATVLGQLGSVGIGIGSPYAKLDVAGNIVVTSHKSDNPHDPSERGNYYIGSKSGSSNDGFAGMKMTVVPIGAGNGANLSFVTWGYNISASRDVMVITPQGNVGIGTESPSAKLDINNGSTAGAIKIVDGTQGEGKILTSDANGVGTWQMLTSTLFPYNAQPTTHVLQPPATASQNKGCDVKLSGGPAATSGTLAQPGGDLHLTGGNGYSNASYNPGKVYIYGGVTMKVGGTVSNANRGNIILAHDGTNSSGNVGIGISDPQYKLSVAGDIGVDNAITLKAKNSSGAYETFMHPRWSDDKTYINYGSAGFNIRNNSGVNTMYMTNDNKVGIGTTTPSVNLEIKGTTNPSSLKLVGGTDHLQFNQTSDNTGSQIEWGDDAADKLYLTHHNYSGNTMTNVMTFTKDYVGIGTTTPSTKLDINNGSTSGAIKIVDGTQGQGKVLTSDANGVGTWQSTTAFAQVNMENSYIGIDAQANPRIALIKKSGSAPRIATDNTNDIIFSKLSTSITTSNIGTGTFTDLMVINNNGNVGIGTASPYTKLDVVGNIYTALHKSTNQHDQNERGTYYIGSKSGSSSDDGFAGIKTTVEAGAGGCGNGAKISFQTWGCNISASRDVMTIDQRGNVGIGTNSPATKLDISNGSTSGAIKIVDGTQGAGKVLTSDANGVGTWQAPAGSSNMEITSNGRLLLSNTPGGTSLNNIFIGNNAGVEDITATENAWGNTAVGYNVLTALTTGTQNTAVGRNTLKLVTSGANNSAYGASALEALTTGSGNSGFGSFALFNVTTGNDNTALGHFALKSNTTGSNNVAVGRYSLTNLTVGVGNICIGYGTGNQLTTGGNNIIIGQDAQAKTATGSNQLNIGNWIYGDNGLISIGSDNATTTQNLLHVHGGAHFNNDLGVTDATMAHVTINTDTVVKGCALTVAGPTYIGDWHNIESNEIKPDNMGTYYLWVQGGVVSEDFVVAPQADWRDYVFAPEYKLPALSEVESFIKTNRHLEGVPSESDVKRSGYNVSSLSKVFLEKIEHLYLYSIAQEKKVNSLQEINTNLKKENERQLQILSGLEQRIAALEKSQGK